MNPQDLILDHYHHPRNFGTLPHATHHGETENLSCGDSLAMDIVVKDDIIEEIKWTGNGCALSQASASILSERVKGASLEKTRNISGQDVFGMLGMETLSPARAKCALLSLETIRQAIKNANS